MRKQARKTLFTELEKSGYQWVVFNEETPNRNNGIVECIIDAMEKHRDNTDTLEIPDIRNKLSPIKNLIAMFENGLANGTVVMHDIFLREIEECKKSIAYLSKKR